MKKITNKLAKLRRQQPQEPTPTSVPRITTDTVAEQREAILGSARKYIYPLQHSKHRILYISIAVLVIALITFFAYCTLTLYRLNGSSTFLYRVSQVIPFPVAKAGANYVSYEDYLFELRHYTHYYENQQKLDFSSKEGNEQLVAFRKQALDKVVNDAFIKQLAGKYRINVTEAEIDEQIAVVRNQNRLGSDDQVFEDVLNDYWGWSVNDFRRSLRSQILTQKVVATLDTTTNDKAKEALAQLNAGEDFEKIAEKYSEDVATAKQGGSLGVVDRTNRDITAKTVDTLYGLKEGQYSDIINIGYSLEIVQNVRNTSDGKREGAHILFNFEDISFYLNDIKNQQQVRYYISL